MHPVTASVILAAVLGLLTGAALSRANLCMMRAAHELSRGRFAAVGGLLIASAAGAVAFFLSGLAGWHGRAIWAWPTALTLVGAVLFGIGARLNAACSLGTVGRLAQGDLGALATIAGMLLAMLLMPHTSVQDAPPPWAATASVTIAGAMAAAIVLFLLVAWRRGGASHLWMPLLLGVAAALLYSLHAQITWTEMVTQAAKGAGTWGVAAVGFVGLLVGAFLAAYAGGRVHWRRPHPARFGREFTGGVLMGAGSLLIPGATDALAFYGVPSGSPHAVTAWAVLFGTVVLSFWLFPASGASAAGISPAVAHTR